MLPISPDVLYDELESIQKVVVKWKERVKQIPGVDTPGSEEELQAFIRELCGELMLSAGKSEGIAVVFRDWMDT